METIYIVAIIAVAIVIAVVGVAWLLRDRITSGRFRGSMAQQEVEAEIKAAAPRPGSADSPPAPLPPGKSPSVDISDNWMMGGQVVRIWRDGVRFARNRLLGKQRYEVKASPAPPASPPKRRKK